MANDTVNNEEQPTVPSEPITETPPETPSVIPETEPKVPEEPAIVDADKVIVEDRKEESEPPKPVEEKPVEKVETPPPLAPKPNSEPPATPPPEPTAESVEVAKPNVESPMSNDEQTPQTSSEVSVGNPTQSSTEVSVGKHDPRFTKDIPAKVLELTDEEIDAARKLWAREHLDQARAKANENRKVHMNQMMKEIEKFVKTNPGTSVHTIANSVRLSEKLTSGYLEKLVKAKRVKASGNTRNRRYS